MSIVFPSEPIDLPSKGWFYPESSPLSKGQVDIKYMTSAEENIITSANLIDKGLVFDRLLQALLIDKTIKYDEILIGDRDALLIAARSLGYGKDYPVPFTCRACAAAYVTTVDINTFNHKEIPFLEEQKGKNLFTFELPVSKQIVEFRMLNIGDEVQIDKDAEGWRKAGAPDVDYTLTTTMKRCIQSVNGKNGTGDITTAVDNMLVRDAKAFRTYAKSITPEVEMFTDHVCSQCDDRRRLRVPLNSNFFWPDSTS
jgi:hypothetical protein